MKEACGECDGLRRGVGGGVKLAVSLLVNRLVTRAVGPDVTQTTKQAVTHTPMQRCAMAGNVDSFVTSRGASQSRASRSSAVASVLSCLAKQKRTTPDSCASW